MMQKMQQTLPIIPWMGGKRRLAKHLLPMFPEHSCYVELFSGGAALFFMRPIPAKVEVLNDINGQLINLYRVVQHHFDEFVRQFEWTLTSRETFAGLQNTPPECMTDIQRAARFFYLQHTFFYADPPYWQTAGYDQSFGWEQYELLAKVMAESKGKVMLSINDHPDIRELFKDFRITQLKLAYTVGRNKTGKISGELVVCNW